jgi:hypothetical protein
MMALSGAVVRGSEEAVVIRRCTRLALLAPLIPVLTAVPGPGSGAWAQAAVTLQALGSSNTYGTGDDFPDDDGGFPGDPVLGPAAGWFPVLDALLPDADAKLTRFSFPTTTSLDFHPTLWPQAPFAFPFFEMAMLPENRGNATVALFVGFHINDVRFVVPAAETRQNFSEILDELFARGFERAYISIEPTLQHSPLTGCETGNPELWSQNVAALLSLIAERPGVFEGPDFAQVFAQGDRRTWWFSGHEGELDCYLHPNGWGYMEMAALWCDHLKAAGEIPQATDCNLRPDTPSLVDCQASFGSVECKASAPSDPDVGQPLTQFAWAVDAGGFCGAASDVDLALDGSTEDDRLEVTGPFTIDGLTSGRDYTVCLVTYDGIRASFFATQTVTTVTEPGRSSLVAGLAALAWLARVRTRRSR